MAIINPLPYTFVNGTVIDATQVNGDFNQVVANVNANGAENGVNNSITQLTGLTTPLSVGQGGTGVNALNKLTNSLAAGVAISNVAFTDGPTVIQGTSGNWFVSGTVTIIPSSNQIIKVILWDGNNIIASTSANNSAGGPGISISLSLSGFVSNPTGNLRISAQLGSGSGTFQANNSGEGKDSTITAIQIP